MVARRLMGPRTKSHAFNILQLTEERGRGSSYRNGIFKILLHVRQSLDCLCHSIAQYTQGEAMQLEGLGPLSPIDSSSVENWVLDHYSGGKLLQCLLLLWIRLCKCHTQTGKVTERNTQAHNSTSSEYPLFYLKMKSISNPSRIARRYCWKRVGASWSLTTQDGFLSKMPHDQ